MRPATPAEMADAVEQAFDYRGDVTLELTSGEKIEGYVCNRETNASPPCLQIIPTGADEQRRIPYAHISAIAFTGKDTASGKSWEAWVAKKESQRRAETNQALSEAQARGHL